MRVRQKFELNRQFQFIFSKAHSGIMAALLQQARMMIGQFRTIGTGIGKDNGPLPTLAIGVKKSKILLFGIFPALILILGVALLIFAMLIMPDGGVGPFYLAICLICIGFYKLSTLWDLYRWRGPIVILDNEYIHVPYRNEKFPFTEFATIGDNPGRHSSTSLLVWREYPGQIFGWHRKGPLKIPKVLDMDEGLFLSEVQSRIERTAYTTPAAELADYGLNRLS